MALGLLDPRLQLLLGQGGLLGDPDRGGLLSPGQIARNSASVTPQFPQIPPQQTPRPPQINPARSLGYGANDQQGGGSSINPNTAMNMAKSLKGLFSPASASAAPSISGNPGLVASDDWMLAGLGSGAGGLAGDAGASGIAGGLGGETVGGLAGMTGANTAGAGMSNLWGLMGSGGAGGGAGSSLMSNPAGLFAALIASGKIIENNNANNPVGRGFLSMLGPSLNQIKADPKLGVTTALGLPFLNGFIRNDKAANADPEWLPFLKGMF